MGSHRVGRDWSDLAAAGTHSGGTNLHFQGQHSFTKGKMIALPQYPEEKLEETSEGGSCHCRLCKLLRSAPHPPGVLTHKRGWSLPLPLEPLLWWAFQAQNLPWLDPRSLLRARCPVGADPWMTAGLTEASCVNLRNCVTASGSSAHVQHRPLRARKRPYLLRMLGRAWWREGLLRRGLWKINSLFKRKRRKEEKEGGRRKGRKEGKRN